MSKGNGILCSDMMKSAMYVRGRGSPPGCVNMVLGVFHLLR
jgi:hypothetical protein